LNSGLREKESIDLKPEIEASSPEYTFSQRILRAVTMDVTPLRVSRHYRLLYAGQFISAFGSAISYVVLPLQMYQLTKSLSAVATLGLVEFGPMFVMAFIGGALADHLDRRRLILAAEAGMALCCIVLVVNSLQAQPRPWVLLLVAGLFAALNAIHRPAIEALTPRIVPAEHMPAVSALGAFRYSFNFIVGPAVAGVIAARFGASTAYAIDAATYLISFVAVLGLPSIRASSAEQTPGLRTIVEGWTYARSRQELLGTYLIDLNAMFFGMPISLFPAIAESFGGASVGLFYSMMAVGPLIATLTSGWTTRIHRHGLAVTISVVVWGTAIVGFGLASNLWLALFFLALAGAADAVSGFFRMTIWNQTIPDHLRGRLAGIEMVSYMTGPYLGNAEAGFVAARFGLSFSVVSGGALCILGAGALALLLPRFIQYDGRDGVAHKQAEEEAQAARASAL
jgi:MFS family permease